jgi:hypothetical protein
MGVQGPFAPSFARRTQAIKIPLPGEFEGAFARSKEEISISLK